MRDASAYLADLVTGVGSAQIGEIFQEDGGAAYRIRTYDPIITNDVLYQLS